MSIRLIPVPFHRLRPLWPWVRAGLEQGIFKSHARGMPEDVYCSLKQGLSYLYLIDDGTPLGFLVFQHNKGVDGMELHVFSIWCPGFEAVSEEVFRAADEIGQSLGAVRMTCSGRKGWSRYGFRVATINFERDIPQAVPHVQG